MIAKPIALFIIIASFLGGFVLMGGNLSALWHPSELVVILGIALGAFMASTPVNVWMRTLHFVGRFFAGERVSKQLYAETLGLLEELSRLSRGAGVLALEKHLIAPEDSPIFTQYPRVLKHPDLKKFITENFSYLLLNPPASQSFHEHLAKQISTMTNSMMEVPRAAGKVADWLPGFGIVAAVMGVILTMDMLGGDMDVAVIGGAIGAALVGTLTGVFLAFAILAPFVHSVEIMVRQDRTLFEMAASFMVAYANGVSPSLSVEIGRQIVPPEFAVPREEEA
ncbi:flagellar motor protein MotA [Thiosulfatimonas sediminis]|uniref:Flagellar motor protein MotA n=1 Tax=Thiosulfatimonas sediminis TaxID=2675054 RepID=A0A6F8PSI6_9GAMM|nr:motility-associated protein [Thiosulfatimonas sediminis]BBP44994.1 flagellar motor protein MotA [Thiosulfatimonas sediminis]